MLEACADSPPNSQQVRALSFLQCDCDAFKLQLWMFDGLHRFLNVYEGKCLEAYKEGSSNKAQFVVCNSNETSFWNAGREGNEDISELDINIANIEKGGCCIHDVGELIVLFLNCMVRA